MPELVRAVVTPLADDAIVEGEVMDSAPVAAAVRETLAAAGESRGRLVVAVGGRDVIVKRIRAARAQGAEAAALLRWEAEQHVPFDMNSVALDFHVLDPDGSGPEMTVLLARRSARWWTRSSACSTTPAPCRAWWTWRRSRCTTRSARPAPSAGRAPAGSWRWRTWGTRRPR
jgi:Tfp pilus assembly PilM family ATPase